MADKDDNKVEINREEKKSAEKETKKADKSSENNKAEKKSGSQSKKPEPKKSESKKSDGDKEKIKELEKKYDELNDKYLRMAAEYENYRKRTTKELAERVVDTRIKVVSEIIPVVDNFERAAESTTDDITVYKKGVEMTEKQLKDVLSKLGVESFGEEGDEFDPNIHSAMMHTENDDEPENSVSQVFMKGYKIGDKIIRPAAVKVNK
jgi:molecular chaperone GrpE